MLTSEASFEILTKPAMNPLWYVLLLVNQRLAFDWSFRQRLLASFTVFDFDGNR
jgi:hypothetical protein